MTTDDRAGRALYVISVAAELAGVSRPSVLSTATDNTAVEAKFDTLRDAMRVVGMALAARQS